MLRADGRTPEKIRNIRVQDDFIDHALASVLIEFGNTKVLCAVSLEQGVPSFLRNQGQGWMSAEYAMLPVATHNRQQRESTSHKRQSRAIEISRLIGRVCRAVVDLKALGELTLLLDCDVIQADGGTRTAAITGISYALKLAQEKLLQSGQIKRAFIKSEIAAISVGITRSGLILDLDYLEDSRAMADFNFVLTRSGEVIEVQGTAEQQPISWANFEQMHALAQSGILQIFEQLP